VALLQLQQTSSFMCVYICICMEVRIESAKSFTIHFEVVACVTPCRTELHVVPPVICILSEIGSCQRTACIC
jgi:hypothetical protein